jgi:hypothetical protein
MRADCARGLADTPRDPLAHAFAAFDDILVVTREELVAAIAAQHDLDVFGRELRHHVGRNRGRVAKRFVEIPGEILDDLHTLGRRTRS